MDRRGPGVGRGGCPACYFEGVLNFEGREVRVIERSAFARIARFVLRARRVAMVLGESIHLSGASREEFLRNEGWVRHELVHVAQFRHHGFWRFLWLYLVESARRGYRQNRFEVEARVRSGYPRK